MIYMDTNSKINTFSQNAYLEAEEEAARFFFDALGFRVGQDAFIGHPYSPILAQTFQFDEAPADYGAQFAVSRRIESVALYASLRLMSQSRAEVARWLASAVALMPYVHTGASPLEQLRIRQDGLQAIEQQVVQTRSGEDSLLVWQATLGLDAVYRVHP